MPEENEPELGEEQKKQKETERRRKRLRVTAMVANQFTAIEKLTKRPKVNPTKKLQRIKTIVEDIARLMIHQDGPWKGRLKEL